MKQTTINCVHPSFDDTLKEEELDSEWLSLICKAKEMGISLTEIKEYLLNPGTIIRKDR
ncbi:anti-repressor SinI family protein [Neobacillus novalis]|uniref:Anti-repressor SinI family protein n=1 Tax=Neobacillus novalis TaxID=220687 RepID=A0AA95S932_9BACI|nr:anti-repressor SinI family protein [Neobacillus novalis]WHY86535.1 anti-repressor SinI family protein [Neobacillus novalis]